jgi:hypothetical protein
MEQSLHRLKASQKQYEADEVGILAHLNCKQIEQCHLQIGRRCFSSNRKILFCTVFLPSSKCNQEK